MLFTRKCRETWSSQRDRKWQYGGAMHAGIVKLHARKHMPSPVRPQPHTDTRARAHTHTHPRACVRTHRTIQYLLLFHDNNGFINAPQCYVIRTLPVLLIIPLSPEAFLNNIYKQLILLHRKLTYLKGCKPEFLTCRFRNSARTLAILRDFFVFLILSMQKTGRYIYSIRVDIFQIVYNV
jgi:hypothetical protein